MKFLFASLMLLVSAAALAQTTAPATPQQKTFFEQVKEAVAEAKEKLAEAGLIGDTCENKCKADYEKCKAEVQAKGSFNYRPCIAKQEQCASACPVKKTSTPAVTTRSAQTAQTM